MGAASDRFFARKVATQGVKNWATRSDVNRARVTVVGMPTMYLPVSPPMANRGRNEAMATAVVPLLAQKTRDVPKTEARRGERPLSRRIWMLSVTTTASSTRSPSATMRPPMVMRLEIEAEEEEAQDGATYRKRDDARHH